MELFAISSMSEVGSELKVCFGAFSRHTNDFWAAKKSPKECDQSIKNKKNPKNFKNGQKSENLKKS